MADTKKSLSDEEKFPYLFNQTDIDPRTRTRTVPMEVLALGAPRTGTSSMMEALAQLGISSYHMNCVFKNPRDSEMWHQAAEAKFSNRGEKFTKKEWDNLMGDKQACLDLPSAAFMPELIEAYPDAKVIIAMRDPDKWYASLMATIRGKLSWSLLVLTPFDPFFYKRWVPMLHALMSGMFPAGLDDAAATKAAYIALHEEVRALVPPSQLLEYQLKDGWEPLCKFLGKEVPNTPFPFVNETSHFTERGALMQRMARKRALANVAPYVGMVGAVAMALWMGREAAVGGVRSVLKFPGIMISKV